MNFFPECHKRVLIMGPNGSGKSELARVWLGVYDRVVIVDVKYDWRVANTDKIIAHPKELTKKLLHKYRHIVYRPDFGVLINSDTKNTREADEVPAKCLDIGDCTLYYDDLAFIAPDSSFISRCPNFYLAETTGRGLGVGTWCSTQRPHRIPIVALTESDRRATFFLRHSADRDRAKELISDDIPWHSLRKNEYSFYMSDDRSEYGPIKLAFREEKKSA